MTEAAVRHRLDEAAETILVSPPPTRMTFERAARQRRSSRRRHLGLGVAAVAMVAAPVLAYVVAPDSPNAPASGHRPGKAAPLTDPLIKEQGDCPVEAATDANHSKLLLVHADCSTQVIPTSGTDSVTYAALSPDASRVAFTAYEPQAHLDLIDLNSGARITLAAADDTIGDPVWSPDGDAIAFWRTDDGHVHLYLVRSEDGQWGTPRQITHGDTVDVSPAWSPDGAELVFDRHGQVWTVDAVSGVAHELPDAPDGLKQPFWGMEPGDLYAIATSGDAPGSTFRVVKLNATTGGQVGASPDIDGTVSEAQADSDGVQVAALTSPAVTTTVTSLNDSLTPGSEVSVPNILLTNLRIRGAE